MPRSCSVCTHPDLAAINRAMVAGGSFRKISEQFSLSSTALFRHKAEHLPVALSKARDAQEVADGTNVLAELREAAKRVRLLSDACDRWLMDADDPTVYDIGPRSEEVWCTYLETDEEGKTRKVKARLSELLDRANGQGSILLVETKYADPRDLILKAYDRLQGMLELMAKLIGQLDESPKITLIMAPEWAVVRAAMLAALSPYPDARYAVVEHLLTIEAAHAN